MSNGICSSCGKAYNSFGILDGSAICNECFSEKNPDILEQEDISNNDFDNSSDSTSNFKFSNFSNAKIADRYIELNNIATRAILILHIGISLSIIAVEWWLGLIVLSGGLFFIVVASGVFSIIAEIYRHLKEINSKIKSADKD